MILNTFKLTHTHRLLKLNRNVPRLVRKKFSLNRPSSTAKYIYEYIAYIFRNILSVLCFISMI